MHVNWQIIGDREWADDCKDRLHQNTIAQFPLKKVKTILLPQSFLSGPHDIFGITNGMLTLFKLMENDIGSD